MDEKGPTPTPDHDQGMSSEGSRSERRRRAQEILSTQRSHLDRLEADLAGRLQELAENIAHDLADKSDATIASRAPAAEDANPQANIELQSKLEQLQGQLNESKHEIERLQQELRVRESLLRQAHNQQEQRRVEFAAMHEELADVRAQLTAARGRQDEMRRELAAERERLFALQEESKIERRRLARELKAQHASRMAELETRKAELQSLAAADTTGASGQWAAAQAELLETRRELAALRGKLDERAGELTDAVTRASALESVAVRLRTELEQARTATPIVAELPVAAPAPAAVPTPAMLEELAKLRDERDDLASRLAAAETSMRDLQPSVEDKQDDELQRRLEMAFEDVRDLRRANGELEAKLTKARSGQSGPAGPVSTGLDWEAQKQRLLASLEADDRDDDEADEERVSIKEAIRVTDQVIAQKDEEIAQLRRQLEEHSSSASGQNSPASSIGDSDEQVQQEREKLRAAVAEWRDKIGKAEIDISVERAKLARDKAELEDKLRSLQRDQQSSAKEGEHAEPGKLPRGRWLARLGLKDLDDSQ